MMGAPPPPLLRPSRARGARQRVVSALGGATSPRRRAAAPVVDVAPALVGPERGGERHPGPVMCGCCGDSCGGGEDESPGRRGPVGLRARTSGAAGLLPCRRDAARGNGGTRRGRASRVWICTPPRRGQCPRHLRPSPLCSGRPFAPLAGRLFSRPRRVAASLCLPRPPPSPAARARRGPAGAWLGGVRRTAARYRAAPGGALAAVSRVAGGDGDEPAASADDGRPPGVVGGCEKGGRGGWGAAVWR